MGLCWAYSRHFDAGIHQNEIAGIQAYHAQEITNLSILAGAKEIWHGGPSPPPPQLYTKT